MPSTTPPPAVTAYAPSVPLMKSNRPSAALKAYLNGQHSVSRRQVLFNLKTLMDKHLEELTYLLAKEMGKKWDEAMGDVLKVTEVVEFACGAPHIMKGDR
jgi:malonate-semialdehyde dehydrogenase (acetylating)/methylmalonate-semialdehyde dehydrogenase